MAVEAARLRCLRQGDEQSRLTHRKLLRRLSEIRKRRRPDAFDLASEGREIEIEREDLSLGEA